MSWSLKELGQYADFVRGPFGGSLKKEYFVEDGFAVYEQQHAINNQFSSIRYFIDQKKFDEMKRFELRPNDLIMSCSGTMGKVAVVPQNIKKGIINQALLKITPSKNLEGRFLEYYMQSVSFLEHLNKDAKGVAIKNVASVKELKTIPIPIPPLSEQQQIVKKLDTAFDLIESAKANIEKNIQNAKELFQSKLNQVFSEKGEGENFELKKLSELGSITSSKRIYKSEYVSEGVPFYRTKELKELAHGKEISLELYITKERYVEIKNRFGVPLVGDILLSAVGTIGEILVIENENEFYFKDGNIVWFKDFRMVNPYYLRYLLITFVENIKNMAQGAAYSALTIEKINEYKVYFPKDLKIQQNIVEQLDILSAQTKHLQQKYQQKLVNLEEFKKSILDKAFKGEL